MDLARPSILGEVEIHSATKVKQNNVRERLQGTLDHIVITTWSTIINLPELALGPALVAAELHTDQ